jgi:hypothetical protein
MNLLRRRQGPGLTFRQVENIHSAGGNDFITFRIASHFNFTYFCSYPFQSSTVILVCVLKILFEAILANNDIELDEDRSCKFTTSVCIRKTFRYHTRASIKPTYGKPVSYPETSLAYMAYEQ